MLHISLLGEQVIKSATGNARTRSSRTVELVAFLVVHAGCPQARQRIAMLFWPDSTDEQALTNLRRELHHLRSALQDDSSLVVTSKQLGWQDTDTCRVDVRAFEAGHRAAMLAVGAGDTHTALERAAAAVDVYRGELLPAAFDDWLLEARSELERKCVELVDLVCAARTKLGDLPGAADAARRRIQLRPLEELGYRRLIELQGELGDRAGAVSTYHHCASVLERELGIEPDPATRRALDRLLARTVASPAGPPRTAPPSGRSGPAPSRLIGRNAELGLVHELWRRAADGRPSLALVCGDPGVGKTRLVAELAGLVGQHGAVVASAQCFGTAGQLALSPVADWLRAPAVRTAMDALDPVWQVEVERLVPSGGPSGRAVAASGPVPSSRAMVDAWQRHRFYEGLARALIAVGRPLLLVLDNLQWCDQETLSFLTFGLGLTADAPVMVAATVRDGGSSAVLADWTARMRATGLLTELVLKPLDLTDTVRLAETITGRPLATDDADLLQAATGGFPLHIVEAARSSAERGADGPLPADDLAAVLRNRLEQVTASAREVAGLAAAVGRNFSLDLLTEASDLDADSVVRAVDELWRHRILRELGDGYDFSHDLLRDAAYAQISPPQRWLLHRRIAQGLELLHADEPDAVSAQLAEQCARGGRGERAVAYYRRAADVAGRMYAHAEAIRLLEEALAIVRALPDSLVRSRKELQLLEAMAAPLNARYGYSSSALRQTLERSIELAETTGQRSSALTGLVGLWTSQFVQGYAQDAHRTATRALALVDPGSELSGPAHFAVAGSAVSLGRPAEALRHFELAAEFGTTQSLSVGTRPDVHGRAWAAHAHWLLGHDEDALTTCTAAIALARTSDTPYSLAVALAYGCITHQLRQDVGALRESVAELRGLCERYDFAYYREWGLILDGWSRTDGSGLQIARRGVERLSAAGSFARMPYWLSLVADLAHRDGQPETARSKLDAAAAAGLARDDVWWLPEVLRMRAAYDDGDAAVARLESATALASAHGSVTLVERCAHDLALRGVPNGAFGVPATR
ncbi:MAG: ATP-binding protein [Jatrophihabitantaceae bacterium]